MAAAGWLLLLLVSVATAEEKALFIGNSFTNRGPVPVLVRGLAIDAGWPTPTVAMQAYTSRSLEWQRTHAPTLAAVDKGGWDHVVIQDLSTRPTDAAGLESADALGFKQDATWFYDRIKAASPKAQVVLYETWARREDDFCYPKYYATRTAMHEQLVANYRDAATKYIPTHSAAERKTDLLVAPAGEAWQKNYLEKGVNLHAPDKYHPNNLGAYLNALVLYSTIFDRSTLGLTPLNGVSYAEAAKLQKLADSITGKTTPGGPTGQVKSKGITNASFEGPSLAQGAVAFAGGFAMVDGWIVSDAKTNGAGVRSIKTDFPTPAAAGVTDGIQYLMVNSGRAMQQLTDTLVANTTYTLTIAVGRRNLPDPANADYYIRIYAGDQQLAEFTGKTQDIPPGTFADRVLEFTSGATVEPDQRLRIEMGIVEADPKYRMNGLGFDNVGLKTTAAR